MVFCGGASAFDGVIGAANAALRGCLFRSLLSLFRYAALRGWCRHSGVATIDCYVAKQGWCYSPFTSFTTFPLRVYIASSSRLSVLRAVCSPCTKWMVWGQRRMRLTKLSSPFWSAWAE